MIWRITLVKDFSSPQAAAKNCKRGNDGPICASQVAVWWSVCIYRAMSNRQTINKRLLVCFKWRESPRTSESARFHNGIAKRGTMITGAMLMSLLTAPMTALGSSLSEIRSAAYD
jgi:hypothetical protein